MLSYLDVKKLTNESAHFSYGFFELLKKYLEIDYVFYWILRTYPPLTFKEKLTEASLKYRKPGEPLLSEQLFNEECLSVNPLYKNYADLCCATFLNSDIGLEEPSRLLYSIYFKSRATR
jgi:hypothetical protein